MKKVLYLAAICAAAMVGCTNNDETPEQQEINFSPLSYKSTRAIIDGQIYGLSAPSFGLFAYYTGNKDWEATDANRQAYFENLEITADNTDNIWKSTTKKYWPIDGGKLTFIGYSPKTTGVTATYNPNASGKGLLTISNYTVGVTLANLDPDNQVDLLYSKPYDAMNKTTNDGNYQYASGSTSSKQGVNIKFRHALTQVIVKAKIKEVYPEDTYSITKLELKNLKNNGNFTLTSTYASTYTESNDVPIWNNQSGDFTQTLFNNTTTPKAIDTDPATLVSFPAVLVLPQDLIKTGAGDNTTDQIIEVDLVQHHGDIDILVTRTVYLNNGTLTSFGINKKIVITLTIGADEILYAPSVADWDSSTSSADL